LELFEELVRRRAEDVMNFVDLVELVVAREERKQGEHFKIDAANAPVVHLMIIVAVSQQALGRSVPPGGDVLSEGRLRIDASAGTKVGQLDTVVLDEDVLAAIGREASDVTDNCKTGSALTA
jgi:hypothetical protein